LVEFNVTKVLGLWITNQAINFSFELKPSGSTSIQIDRRETTLTGHAAVLQVDLTGRASPAGPIGLTGPAGPKGSTAATGPQGPAVPQRQQAPQGLAGTAGIFGTNSVNFTNSGHEGANSTLGEITLNASVQYPDDPLPSDRRLLSIQQNSALFALLGTNYGGDGVSNFALPNLL
jgi:hypothetical protein